MTIVDSGTRKTFETGAVRDCPDGKGRCDLLPLDIIAEFYDDGTLQAISRYMDTAECKYLWLAFLEFCKKIEIREQSMILEVSKQFEDGAAKYGLRNWEKGINLSSYIDSAVRHYLKYLRGDTDEPHDRALGWNLLCAIWTHKNKPELIDIMDGKHEERM